MKKFILLSIVLLMVVLADNASAQIVGRDDRPYKKDTIITPPKPYVRKDADTLWQRPSDAERRQDSIKWRRKADSTAAAVKYKSAEIAAKVNASLRDCSLKNVKGPKGETVYVDEYDRRYYINKEGTRVFLKRPIRKN